METYRTYTNKVLGGRGEYPNTPIADRQALELVANALEQRRQGFKRGIADIERTTDHLLKSDHRSANYSKLPNYRAVPFAVDRWTTQLRFGKRADAIARVLDNIYDRMSFLPKADIQ